MCMRSEGRGHCLLMAVGNLTGFQLHVLDLVMPLAGSSSGRVVAVCSLLNVPSRVHNCDRPLFSSLAQATCKLIDPDTARILPEYVKVGSDSRN